MMLLIYSVILVAATIICNFDLDDDPVFLFAEFILNTLILGDFVLRVRMVGFKKFFEGGKWNYFDAFVVTTSFLIFAILLISSTGDYSVLEEVSEDLLLLVWGVFQSLRMIVIVKK